MSIRAKISQIKEGTWAWIILATSFIYLVIIYLLSEGLYGDTDSIGHYQLAHYAFKYPKFFVHHWGKPLFTTLSAPFAQLGFHGAVLFNLLSGLLTSWLIYRIARQFNYRYALLAIPFALFAPVYMVNLFTSLTEILFGLVLVAAVYTFLREKFLWSAVIISFIPFARTEGIMFIALFLLALILVRQYKAIPFLLSGFVLFSLAGYFHYREFFWFFTAMPYGETGSALYGSGSFMFYLERFHHLLGHPLTILAGFGLIILLIQLFSVNKPVRSVQWVTLYILVIGSFTGFILAHSFLWWQGMMGVLASTRFMACIMPLGGLLAMVGLDYLFFRLIKPVRMQKTIALAITGLVIWTPYTLNEIPAKLTRSSQVMKETADRLRETGIEGRRLIFFDPKLAFYLKIDMFDQVNFHFNIPDREKPDLGLPEGSLVIYDPHFGEFEKKVSLTSLIDHPSLKLIDAFVPTKNYNFSNGQIYMSAIFERTGEPEAGNSWTGIDSLHFGEQDSIRDLNGLADAIFQSGQTYRQLNPTTPYSPSIKKHVNLIGGDEKVIIRSSAKIYLPSHSDPTKVFLVLSIHDPSGETVRYFNIPASYFKPTAESWCEVWMIVPVETGLHDEDLLKLYVWNHGEKEVFVADLRMEYLPVIK